MISPWRLAAVLLATTCCRAATCSNFTNPLSLPAVAPQPTPLAVVVPPPTVIADVTGIQDAKCVSGTQTVFHLPKRAEEPECKLPAEAASDPDSEQELVPHAGNGSAPLNYAEIAPDDKEPVQPSSVRGVVLACCQPLTDDFT